MSNAAKDLYNIRKLGIKALTESLGPTGMVEFIRQFDSGHGDYTKDRHEWLDNMDIETIAKQVEIKRSKTD